MTLYLTTLSLDDLASMTLEEYSTLELTEPVVINVFGIVSDSIIMYRCQHDVDICVSDNDPVILFECEHETEIWC